MQASAPFPKSRLAFSAFGAVSVACLLTAMLHPIEHATWAEMPVELRAGDVEVLAFDVTADGAYDVGIAYSDRTSFHGLPSKMDQTLSYSWTLTKVGGGLIASGDYKGNGATYGSDVFVMASPIYHGPKLAKGERYELTVKVDGPTSFPEMKKALSVRPDLLNAKSGMFNSTRFKATVLAVLSLPLTGVSGLIWGFVSWRRRRRVVQSSS